MLGRATVVVGAFGIFPYGVVTVNVLRSLDDGTYPTLTAAVLLLVALAATAAGWGWGWDGVQATAIVAWLLVILAVAVAISSTTNDGINLSTYLFLGFVLYAWILIPAACAPVFIAWVACLVNPERRRANREFRALRREWTVAQSGDMVSRFARARANAAPSPGPASGPPEPTPENPDYRPPA